MRQEVRYIGIDRQLDVGVGVGVGCMNNIVLDDVLSLGINETLGSVKEGDI